MLKSGEEYALEDRSSKATHTKMKNKMTPSPLHFYKSIISESTLVYSLSLTSSIFHIHAHIYSMENWKPTFLEMFLVNIGVTFTSRRLSFTLSP